MQSRPQAWLRQANNDLKLAQLARNNSFLAQACFFASQAAEKALKGALLELGQHLAGRRPKLLLNERRAECCRKNNFQKLALRIGSPLQLTVPDPQRPGLLA